MFDPSALNSLANVLSSLGLYQESKEVSLLKSAGVFLPPPKMVANLKRWVKQKVIGGLLEYLETQIVQNKYAKDVYPKCYEFLKNKTKTRNDLYTNSRGRVEGYITVDLSDWKHSSEEDIAEAEELDRYNKFKKLHVSVIPYARDLGRGGAYGDFWGLQVNPENPFQKGRSDEEVLASMDEYFYDIDTTIEHELIHFGQSILKNIQTLRGEHEKGSPETFGEPGLKLQTPQETLEQEFSRDLNEDRFQREHLKSVEFYTHLHNEIRKAKFLWQKQSNQDSFINFKSFMLQFMKRSQFFQTLKRHNKKLWKKSVGLFYEAVLQDLAFNQEEQPAEVTPYQPGDPIRITAGRYQTMRAEITQVLPEGVKASIDLFGRKIEVTLQPGEFELL